MATNFPTKLGCFGAIQRCIIQDWKRTSTVSVESLAGGWGNEHWTRHLTMERRLTFIAFAGRATIRKRWKEIRRRDYKAIEKTSPECQVGILCVSLLLSERLKYRMPRKRKSWEWSVIGFLSVIDFIQFSIIIWFTFYHFHFLLSHTVLGGCSPTPTSCCRRFICTKRVWNRRRDKGLKFLSNFVEFSPQGFSFFQQHGDRTYSWSCSSIKVVFW